MKRGTITRGERRRTEALLTDHSRQMQSLRTQHSQALEVSRSQGYSAGFSAGTADAKVSLQQATEAQIKAANQAGHARARLDVAHEVLEHAGRLYRERKDNDAAAVREVHRLLVEASK